MGLQTEYNFELPVGFMDNDGNIHKNGTMRMATAADEIIPLKDARVQQNPSYITIILLSRVVTKIGALPIVDTRVIERLFTADLAFLQDLYQQINKGTAPQVRCTCPACGEQFKTPVIFDTEF